MRWFAVELTVVGTALALSACTESNSLTVRATKAEKLECPGVEASRDELRVLQAATVLKVEPHYYWDRCFGIAKITATKLLVRRPAGVSSEQLARNLLCASARATLGPVDRSQVPDDPYGLPGAWVDIDVTPEGDDLVVTLQADSVPNNIRLLRRAIAFAAAQRSSTNQ